MLVVVAGLAAVVVARRSSEPTPKLCAGVGLGGYRTYPSSRAAFRAWLKAHSLEPPASKWKRSDAIYRRVAKTRSVVYSTSKSKHYWSIVFGTGGADANGHRAGINDWQATGACIRST